MKELKSLILQELKVAVREHNIDLINSLTGLFTAVAGYEYDDCKTEPSIPDELRDSINLFFKFFTVRNDKL